MTEAQPIDAMLSRVKAAREEASQARARSARAWAMLQQQGVQELSAVCNDLLSRTPPAYGLHLEPTIKHSLDPTSSGSVIVEAEVAPLNVRPSKYSLVFRLNGIDTVEASASSTLPAYKSYELPFGERLPKEELRMAVIDFVECLLTPEKK